MLDALVRGMVFHFGFHRISLMDKSYEYVYGWIVFRS